MELISGFFFVVIVGIISYLFTREDQQADSHVEVETKKELEKRKNIIEQVENFLSGAKYYEHIGNWNKEKIYKYISNQGMTYEFFEFMTDDNQRIGIDDDWLCFRKMSYKRSNDVVEIVN